MNSKPTIQPTNPQLHSFLPLINTRTRVLIIGSMPGVASLNAQQYYAHPQNQFWKIIFSIFEQGRLPKNYIDKQKTLLKHHLGLWDSLASCHRQGSLDSAIKAPVPNDFTALFKKYPRVHTLVFNGQIAARYFKQFCAHTCTGKTTVILPSTSPAHAALSYKQKQTRWQQALLTALKKPYTQARELL